MTSLTKQTVTCNCAGIPPTMPAYRTTHLVTCPVWVVENVANVVGEVKEPVTFQTSNQRCIHFPALPPYEPCDKCEIERLREWQRKACDVLPLIEREAGTSLAARVSELLRGEGSAPEAAPSIWKRMCDEAPVNDGRMIWWDYGNGGMPVLTKAADFGRTDGGYWAEAVPPTRSVHETSPDDAQDAAKWRALRNCARMTAMGSAGLTPGTSTYDTDYAHVTLNFWTGGKYDSPGEAYAREWLDGFVAKALRACPSVVETKPDDEDSYIHGPGTFPHSDGCRCERCSPPKAGG